MGSEMCIRDSDGAGEYRDGACLSHPTESNRSAGSVATWLSGPPWSGRVEEEHFFRTILRRRRDIGGGTWYPDGRRSLRASASLASDHYRLFGVRSSRDPILLSPHTISPWDTRLCVLGWNIDTVAMTISGLLAKLKRLRDTLNEWSADRVVVSEEELRSLIGRLPYFVR